MSYLGIKFRKYLIDPCKKNFAYEETEAEIL